MEWLAVLLFVFIVAFGLLRRWIGQLQQARMRRLPREGEAALPRSAPTGGGWSEEWGAWPGIETEEDAPGGEEEVEPVRVVTLEDAGREQGLPTEEAPASFTTVVSLEPTRVDWVAEHARLRERVVVVPPPPPPRPAETSSPAARLRDPRELRRALIAAEILGPPRALKPLAEG